MLSKIKLYLKVCNKGEITKRIEYKLKDITGFFYLRNKLSKINKNANLELPKINTMLNYYNEEDFYYVFNKKISYSDIKDNLVYSDDFWRKCKLSKYADVKEIWEVNRLQFLLPLAMKYINTKDEKYKELIKDILDYWIEKNEFEYSINWSNNLEVAVRAISIVISLIVLNDDNLTKKYSNIIYLHGKYINNEIGYSKSCIPNNHLLGEAISLLIISKVLETKESKKWEKRALKILNKYNGIISDEGVSKENSFSYQFFVTKMFILALGFIEDDALFQIINKKVLKSLEFLKYTIINSEKVINYGDNDDAFFFSVDNKYNLSKDIMRYYNFFFKGELDEETNIINEILKHYNKTVEKGIENNNNYFCNKNLFIYKWDNNILFFNAKNIEGHAHNDSLAIVLVINGEEVLLDSGTYSYNLDKEKRKYYTSREAHNTILFNKKNVQQVGTFRWNNILESSILNITEHDDCIEVEGIIENACKRRIEIYTKTGIINVCDESIENMGYIQSNWIVKDSHLTNNVIYANNIRISGDEINFKERHAAFSESYMFEKKVNAYKTECKEKINFKIEII